MTIKIEWNQKGFEQLRKAPKVRDFAKELADDIAEDASDHGRIEGYMVTELLLEDPRGAVSVMATGKAGAHNRKHHTLIKALDRARRPW